MWRNAHPCIAIAPLHAASSVLQEPAVEKGYTSAHRPQWRVQLYSLQSHNYIHTVTMAARVLGLRCSCRVLAVALESQVIRHEICATQSLAVDPPLKLLSFPCWLPHPWPRAPTSERAYAGLLKVRMHLSVACLPPCSHVLN